MKCNKAASYYVMDPKMKRPSIFYQCVHIVSYGEQPYTTRTSFLTMFSVEKSERRLGVWCILWFSNNRVWETQKLATA